MATTYKCKYKNSSDELETQVRKYCEYYNDEIDFEDYYYKLYGVKLPYNGKDKCKLHDEVNGESFSYSKSSKIWSCWGSCKTTAAGVVEYHQMYLHKTRPFVTMIDALNSLREMYPQLPKFTYSPGRKNRDKNKSKLNTVYEKYMQNTTEYIKGQHTKEYNRKESDRIICDNTLEDFDRLCLFAFTHNYIDRKE